MTTSELKGKHALITGAGSGIGAGIARAFDAAGIRTTLAGRRAGKLDAVARTLDHAQVCVLDVTDEDAVTQQLSELDQPVDILVNNAGIAPSSPFHRHSTSDWHDTFAVNVHGAFYCTRAVVGAMRDRDYGRIINIASTSALRGYAYVAAYCASKHALLGLTRALAAETAASSITVNAICPGFAETGLLRASVQNIVDKTGRTEAQARTALASNNPQKRFIQPSEVAAAALWLASPEAGSVTGQAISISGGETT